MFGYVKIDKPNTYVKDTILYSAMYCGLCKGIGKACGNISRFALNYDLTFLSLLVHNLLGEDVKIEKQRCIAHHVIKRPVAIPDEITQKVGALNIILAYYKLSDDILDEKKGSIKRSFFCKGYKRAKKLVPELNEIVKTRFEELLNLEKQNVSSPDIVADPFGKMMSEIFAYFLGDRFGENEKNFAYLLGKWIYLIDAVDDFEKDIKKGNYNVFYLANKELKTKKELLSKNKDIESIFSYVLSDIIECSKNLDYKFNHDLIDNIIRLGLIKQTKSIMEK